MPTKQKEETLFTAQSIRNLFSLSHEYKHQNIFRTAWLSLRFHRYTPVLVTYCVGSSYVCRSQTKYLLTRKQKNMQQLPNKQLYYLFYLLYKDMW